MTSKEFLGLPVKGEYNRYATRTKNQRPQEELMPILQKLLDDPEVAAFGWGQYTPYFNDGDACVFSAWGAYVIPANAEESSDKDEDLSEDYYDYEVVFRPWGDKVVSPVHHQDFAHAIEGGEFDNVLLDLFGDPAKVQFDKKTGEIRMTYLDHD